MSSFPVDGRTMDVTHKRLITDDSIPLSDILLELILVVLVLLFSSITGYAVRKKVLKRRYERASETAAADT